MTKAEQNLIDEALKVCPDVSVVQDSLVERPVGHSKGETE